MLSQLLREHPDLLNIKPVVKMDEDEEHYCDVKNEVSCPASKVDLDLTFSV